MSGSLIKINEAVADNSSNKLTVTGIDSTYEVYMVKQTGITIANANELTHFRVTKSGTDVTSSNYDYVSKQLSGDRAFTNVAQAGNSSFGIDSMEDSDYWNGVLYLYNFANASEFDFISYELCHTESNLDLRSQQGGGLVTLASASDGLSFYPASGNIVTGTMTLYGIAK